MPKSSITNFYCVWSRNRTELINYLKEFTKNIPKDGSLLSLTAVCGKIKEYKKFKDIPKKSVKCRCKYHPNHYFIKYEN